MTTGPDTTMTTGAAATPSLRPSGISTSVGSTPQKLEDIGKGCDDFLTASRANVYIVVKAAVMVTGLLGNATLLWLLLRGRRALSASKVVGLNLAVMDIIFLLTQPPISIAIDLYSVTHGNGTTDYVLDHLITASEATAALNRIGCPLLLTCMCVERYLAAAWPVVYLKLGRWEYRAVCSGLVWVATLTMALVAAFVGEGELWVPLVVVMSSLFLVMLGCLGGVVWVLWKPSPAQTRGGSRPLRRRALVNLLAVILPTAIAYLPVIALLPIVSLVQSNNELISSFMCSIIYTMIAFPALGVYIGPMFYLAKARQVMCFWKR